MKTLETVQFQVAQSLAQRAVQTNPLTAINEFEATGLSATDLGKWAYLVKVLNDSVPKESLAVDLLPGAAELLADSSASPVVEIGHDLHRQIFASSLASKLAAAVADIQAGSDPQTVCERIVRAVGTLKDGRATNRSDHVLTTELPRMMERMLSGAPAVKCVPTGLQKLDAVIYGWQPTLCLLGADPGVGKSATLVRSAYNGAMAGIKSVFFSLEDPPSFIATRLVSFIARVEILRILYGKLTTEELAAVEAGLESLGRVSDNIIVFDGSERAMAVERLCATARSLVSDNGVQCVYVDHAGELCSTARDRHDLEVAGQLSALRGLANSTGVPVVVAMHMKRRLNAKPTLSDFANSSGAERKARLAIALTREAGSDDIFAHILKQTNGPSGVSVQLKFDKESGMVA